MPCAWINKMYAKLWILGVWNTVRYVLFIPGNKNDLTENREVPFTTAKDFAEYHSMLDAIETSAKDNNNIEEAFLKIARVSQNWSSDKIPRI